MRETALSALAALGLVVAVLLLSPLLFLVLKPVLDLWERYVDWVESLR